jgi:lactate permease
MVGALGSFVAGSATASNVLFAGFQVAAAEAVGLAPMMALAGQGFGAAIGNVIAPHNIVAGAATVGLIGREGDVLKRTLPLCLVYALLGGGLLLVLAI